MKRYFLLVSTFFMCLSTLQLHCPRKNVLLQKRGNDYDGYSVEENGSDAFVTFKRPGEYSPPVQVVGAVFLIFKEPIRTWEFTSSVINNDLVVRGTLTEIILRDTEVRGNICFEIPDTDEEIVHGTVQLLGSSSIKGGIFGGDVPAFSPKIAERIDHNQDHLDVPFIRTFLIANQSVVVSAGSDKVRTRGGCCC